MKNNLEKETERFEQLRKDPDFAFGLAQSFVSELISLPRDEKYKLLPLFKEIEEECFEHGIVLSNLDYEALLDEKNQWEAKKGNVKKKSNRLRIDDFNTTLFRIFNKYEILFSKVKGFFIFKLENVEISKTRVVFLCDEDCRKHPEILSFDGEDEVLKIEMIDFADFLEAVDKDPDVRDHNYMCVMIVTPNLRSGGKYVEQLNKLNDSFTKCTFVAMKNNPIEKNDDYELRDFAEGLDLITSYSSKIFNNRALSFDDELIIKKLFDGREMILDYKFLKGGNTGAKVIEIQPLKGNQPQMSRFVVKFAAKDSKRKINTERGLFNEFVENYAIPSYSAQYVDTTTREAIKYRYASSDGKTDSFQFAEILSQLTKKDNDISFSLDQVMSELIECAPFQSWRGSTHSVEQTVEELYEDYLQSERKVLRKIGLIKNKAEDQIDLDPLVLRYRKIKKYRLKTCKKICHGDLHSENFFKDEKGVYLIDFGWTGSRHSVIDYATLECSIKFKHIPFFIPVEELEGWEKNLLSNEAFERDYNLSFIRREMAANLFQLILQLREEAMQVVKDSESTLEYLISLFILSFRQIQYSDLNQRYAIKSAEILSNEIIRLIESKDEILENQLSISATSSEQ